jgi:hypothetical protein
MKGVDRTFEAFRDDALQDDDQLAVLRGPKARLRPAHRGDRQHQSDDREHFTHRHP